MHMRNPSNPIYDACNMLVHALCMLHGHKCDCDMHIIMYKHNLSTCFMGCLDIPLMGLKNSSTLKASGLQNL